MRRKILAIDNDDLVLRGLELAFADEMDLEIVPAIGGLIGLEIFKQDPEQFALVLLDYKMPMMTGAEVARELKKINPNALIAMLSGESKEEVEQISFEAGARHFLSKGSDSAQIVGDVKNILAQVADINVDSQSIAKDNSFRIRRVLDQVGRSQDLVQICDLVERYAAFDDAVLIRGESGVGKEAIAAAIHKASGRKGKFVAVNCAAIPRELLESAMFGHEKGSFTGAVSRKIGHFEEASGGTIFLDEIGDMPHELQAKLLRTLQNKVVQPVGGQSKAVDFRVVSATHCDLEQAVKDGKFRADLYFRLKTFSIDVPALRDRPEDIEPLFWHFMNQLEIKSGKRMTVSNSVLRRLKSMSWPGNVRDLEASVKNAFARSGSRITERSFDAADQTDLEKRIGTVKSRKSVPTHKELIEIFEDLERWAIARALSLCEGKKGMAASMLAMNPNTLNYRLVKLKWKLKNYFGTNKKGKEKHMDKKTAIIIGLLGAGPAMGMPAQGSAIEYRAYSVHARTVGIVQELISSKALYASSDATRLLIRRAALDAETISGLESSKEVSVDSGSGDFVVKPDFAVALLKSRAFEGFLPQSIADFVMLQQLQRDASGEVSVELTGFHWAPFF